MTVVQMSWNNENVGRQPHNMRLHHVVALVLRVSYPCDTCSRRGECIIFKANFSFGLTRHINRENVSNNVLIIMCWKEEDAFEQEDVVLSSPAAN